ncbi:MAG: S9 family peptidase [Chitinophagales bacterium]|nr:S9 family peptidase [Chitinophagales bacterium]MDW8428647.1 S9 family peptidase [Chitinophagales bacterium]
MKQISLLLLAVLLMGSEELCAQMLTLEDIFLKRLYRPRGPEPMEPLEDGAHYAVQRQDDQGNWYVLKVAYASGAVTDTLADSRRILFPTDRRMLPVSFSVSQDEQKLLLITEAKPIYRYSQAVVCYVYDRKLKKVFPIAQATPVQEPTFSPDGNKLAYVLDNDLFITDLQTGEEQALTTDGLRNYIINGVCDWVYEEEFSFTRAYQWSPDSRKIAWYRFDESQVPLVTIQYFHNLYPENYTYRYPKVGEANAEVSIHIADLNSGRQVDVALPEEDDYIPRIKWTDDPNLLCVFRMNRWQNRLELLLADAASGVTRLLMREENARYIDIHDHLEFFDHNRRFLWTSERSGYNHLYVGSVTDGSLQPLTMGNWEVTECYGIDKKNGKVYFQSTQASPLERHVYVVDLKTRKVSLLAGEQGWNAARFNQTFSYFVLTHSDADDVPSYWICDRQGRKVRLLEDNSDLRSRWAQLPHQPKEFFTFTTADGTLLHGWLIKPWDFDPTQKYPVFMHGYGGPGSQLVTRSGGPSAFHQFLAQQGYVVACIDNRGTGGRGEEFKKTTYMKLGYYEPRDQIAGARYLMSLPFVDATRISFFGWSYGGYLSLLCLMLGNDVFRAAVAVAPVTDWRFYDTIYTERYMRNTQENPEGYRDGAPLTYVDRIRGSLLLVHGLADDNVHYQNSAVLMKKLYEHNIPFDQLTFPDKNHSISGGNTSYYLYSRIVAWLDQIMEP